MSLTPRVLAIGSSVHRVVGSSEENQQRGRGKDLLILIFIKMILYPGSHRNR
jgi:hypothetical protein